MRSETELDFVFEYTKEELYIWLWVGSAILIGVALAIGLIYLVMLIVKG